MWPTQRRQSEFRTINTIGFRYTLEFQSRSLRFGRSSRARRVAGDVNYDCSIRPRQRVTRIAPCSLGAVREDWREGVMG